jgi:hydroxyacylglutathione hydrolase
VLDTYSPPTYDESCKTRFEKEMHMKINDKLHAFLWNHPMANNCNTYLIIDGEKKILIDPGHYQFFDHVRRGLADLSLRPEDMDAVLITHGHPDHIESVRLFIDTDAKVAISVTEMDFIRRMVPRYGDALGISDFEPDILLEGGNLEIGTTRFDVIPSPGHSPGSVCFFWPDEKVLFTGDVVFNGGIGRTDLPGGNGETLKESIKRISTLDAEYVLSGHGDIVKGKDAVKANFQEIENFWFGYI